MTILFRICLILHAVPIVYGVLGIETTFYDVTNVRQYNNYGNIELFEHNVPEMTSEVRWRFETGMSNDKCPLRDITVLLQHGSYPLPAAQNNYTYPGDFYLNRTSHHKLELNSTGNLTRTTILLPTAGRWFGAAFVDSDEKNEVIKAINDLECHYFIRVNVTTEFLINSNQIVDTSPVIVELLSEERYHLYRFYVEENIWGFGLEVTGCHGDSAGCPIELLSRGGGLPGSDLAGPVETVVCDQSWADNQTCALDVVSPLVSRWHYVQVQKSKDHTDVAVNATLKLVIKACDVSDNPYQRKVNKAANSTSSHPDNSTSAMATNAKKGDTMTISAGDRCGPISSLHRIEDMDDPIYAVYSLGPSSAEEILDVSSYEVELVQFDVLPIKDTGGTLLFKAVLTEFAVNLNHSQNVSVKVCLSPSRIPANGSQYFCSPDGTVELTLDTGENDWTLKKEIPYPEPGPYFIGFQSYCYRLENSSEPSLGKNFEPCVENFTQVIFEITNGPCVNSSCAGNGDCRTYRKGAYIYSSCYCIANYAGYTCEDPSEAASLRLQLIYTMLLSLSNLFFLPAFIVAITRRYYVEAFVYFANMFFSGFYHACDMSPWSTYKLCIMPYGALQYSDFLFSIVSFWVTFVAMAELPPTIVSLCHAVAMLMLAMAVDLATHTLIVYVVPITVGVILVVVMWVIRSVRRKHCYPDGRNWFYIVPGILLAVVGLSLFAFVQNDVNYPYTHSAWHMCISLSIVFLLPQKKMHTCLGKENSSDRSSDEFEFSDHRHRNQFQPQNQFYSADDQDLLVNPDGPLILSTPYGLDDDP